MEITDMAIRVTFKYGKNRDGNDRITATVKEGLLDDSLTRTFNGNQENIDAFLKELKEEALKKFELTKKRYDREETIKEACKTCSDSDDRTSIFEGLADE